MRYGKKIIGLIVALCMVIGLAKCTSKVVPPGTTVIVLKASGQTSVHTSGSYAAYGRDRTYFVDTKLKGFTETMNILCKDRVNMKVDVKWIGSFDVSRDKINIIKEKVPSVKVKQGDLDGYQLSLDQFYKTAIKDIIRANTRAVVSPYVTDAIPDNRKQIEGAIQKRVLERLTKLNYPVKTADILVSNLDFDPEITRTRRAIKAAELEDQKRAALARARVAQAKRDADIAREEGKAEIERAKAKAAANRILAESVTPEILALKQWEVLEAAAKGPNNELVIIPYEALKTGDMMNSTMNRQVTNKLGRRIK